MLIQLLICLVTAAFLGSWAVLPAARLTDGGWSLQFGIPISLASAVVLGTVLYVAGFFAEFPFVLGGLAIAPNAWAVWLKPGYGEPLRKRALSAARPSALWSSTLTEEGRSDLVFYAAAALTAVAVAIALLTDPLTHQSPGTPDATNLWRIFEVIKTGGSIGYPPGWFALLAPAASAGEGVWRFMGASLGLVSVLGVFLLVRPIVGKWLALLLVVLMLTPPMALPMKWSGGFWPTGITMIFVLGASVALIGLFSRQGMLRSALCASLLGVAAAFCSSLPAIQWVPAAIVSVGIAGAALYARSAPGARPTMPQLLACAMALALVTLAAAYAAPHLAVRGWNSAVPPLSTGIASPSLSEAENPVGTERATGTDAASTDTEVIKSMLVVKTSGLLPGPPSLKLGAPLLLLVALLATAVGWSRKAPSLLVFGPVVVVMTFILQTGLVTPYRYTGRVAFYLAFMGLFLIILLLRELFAGLVTEQRALRIKEAVLALALVVLALALLRPPTWERVFFLRPESAFVLLAPQAEASESPLRVATNLDGLDLVDGVAQLARSSDRSADALVIDTKLRPANPPGVNEELTYAGIHGAPDPAADRARQREAIRRLQRSLKDGWTPVARRDGVVVLVKRKTP